ncbi:hypothetical protein CQW23_35378 [Capsicum baccatum]|uniref:Uncharacterized protein n=1 Tax=Capsicum baccatum TaxID=33114 RepID=A0A2G2UWF7_CAPBA|nr:hypothetical protein CQW23_35378 [Capsicum baccatum]
MSTPCHCSRHEAVLAMSKPRPRQCLCRDSAVSMPVSEPVPCHRLRLASVNVMPAPCHRLRLASADVMPVPCHRLRLANADVMPVPLLHACPHRCHPSVVMSSVQGSLAITPACLGLAHCLSMAHVKANVHLDMALRLQHCTRRSQKPLIAAHLHAPTLFSVLHRALMPHFELRKTSSCDAVVFIERPLDIVSLTVWNGTHAMLVKQEANLGEVSSQHLVGFFKEGCTNLLWRRAAGWLDWMGRDEPERQRAESQWIMAARPLCHLQYPFAYLSRLQRILPAARWKLYFKAAAATLPPRRLSQRHVPLGAEAPTAGRQADGPSAAAA